MTTKSPAAADIQVGTNIRQLRLRKGMSQETLAGHLSLTFQQVQKYEKGTNRVSASRLVDIARIFAVPVDTLFTGATAEVDPNAEPLQTMSREALSLAHDFEAIADAKIKLSIRGLVKSLRVQQVADAA